MPKTSPILQKLYLTLLRSCAAAAVISLIIYFALVVHDSYVVGLDRACIEATPKAESYEPDRLRNCNIGQGPTQTLYSERAWSDGDFQQSFWERGLWALALATGFSIIVGALLIFRRWTSWLLS